MENKQIILTLTTIQVNIILAHLSEGKLKDVIEVVNSITSQGNAQIAEAQKPISKKPEEEQKHGTFVLSNDEKPTTPLEPSQLEANPDVIN